MKKSLGQVIENKENLIKDHKTSDSLTVVRTFGTNITNQKLILSPFISNNPIYLECYADDIYTYLYSIETLHTAKFGYLKNQHDINEKMRSILIDWLVDVHIKFKLVPETLYLTVNILDRYLEKTPLSRTKLQLLGVAAMLIASKYEDIYAPDISDFVFITDKAYDRDEIILMESSILKLLEFNVCTPSAYRFLERYCRIIESEDKNFTLAQYFIELTLLEYRMIKYPQSLLAASAVYLMHKVYNIIPEWPDELIIKSPYKENDLKVVSKEMCLLFQRARNSQLQIIRKKFLTQQFFQVANTSLIC